jgi:hypothetical protein
MNKYLMLSSAALLAGTVAANASGSWSFQWGTAYGGSYCDGGLVYTGADGGANSGAVRVWTHENNNCGGGTSEGLGVLGKTPGLGKVSMMSDNFESKNYGCNYLQIAYTLPKKIKNGAPWTLWIGESGFTAFEANRGVLINVHAGRYIKGHGTTSTLSLVKQFIQAHRNAKALSE